MIAGLCLLDAVVGNDNLLIFGTSIYAAPILTCSYVNPAPHEEHSGGSREMRCLMTPH